MGVGFYVYLGDFAEAPRLSLLAVLDLHSYLLLTAALHVIALLLKIQHLANSQVLQFWGITAVVVLDK
jgi:hypothetical protein